VSSEAPTRAVSKLATIALAALLAVALLLAVGCASKPAAPSAADQKAACAENQAHIRQAMDLFYADSQIYPPIATVVEKLHVACPSGGTYVFDEKTDTVSCTVHGHL
jgi:hypothetical protein